MLLEAILSNKTKLKKLIVSIIQPPNANNKENTAVLVSRIKGEEYLIKKGWLYNNYYSLLVQENINIL